MHLLICPVALGRKKSYGAAPEIYRQLRAKKLEIETLLSAGKALSRMLRGKLQHERLLRYIGRS
jgi:hypothetical protein